jgi:putative transposase
MSLSKRFIACMNATIKAIDPSSALGIAQAEKFSHDTVYRVLLQAGFAFSMVALNRLQSIGGLKGGYLVLDDSFIIRFGSGKLKLKKIRNSTTGQYTHGFNVVMLIWTNGKIRIPIGFRLFLAGKGEPSKIALALEMLNEAKAMGFEPKYVLFDAWYGAECILNYLEGAAWKFVKRQEPMYPLVLRKNRLLDSVSVSLDRRVYWVKVGLLEKMSTKVAVARHQKQYLVSNDLSLDRVVMRLLYRIPQNIEEAFRSLKQELGWEGFRFRTLGTLEAFLGLTLAGYAVIEVLRANLKLSFYKCRTGLICGRIEVPTIVIDNCFAAA